MKKLKAITQYTLEKMKNAIDAGLILHDTDLRGWALQAQKDRGHKGIRFKASLKWLHHFKTAHRISDLDTLEAIGCALKIAT